MLLPTVTWGTLRRTREKLEGTSWTTSTDRLSDPDTMQASLDKLDDEPVYRFDPRKNYTPGPVEYYLTAAKGFAISLARHDADAGTVTYRQRGRWTAQAPSPVPVSGTIHVTEDAVQLWDQRRGRISVRAFVNTNLDKPYGA